MGSAELDRVQPIRTRLAGNCLRRTNPGAKKAGTEGVSFTPVQTDAAVHWANMNLQSVIDESGAWVTHGELPILYGDNVQMVQLFQNLIGNAIKYAKPGLRPEIHISAVPQGSQWLFEVRDNGIGIDPLHSDRIFGVFKRLHGKETPGTGIGLAICKRIVEKHGGRIWVESEPEQGSRFYFTLEE